MPDKVESAIWITLEQIGLPRIRHLIVIIQILELYGNWIELRFLLFLIYLSIHIYLESCIVDLQEELIYEDN